MFKNLLIKSNPHTFILKKTCIFVIERQLYFLKHAEYQLQKAVCKYLDLQYPDVLYLSDTVASVKLTIPQAARNKAIQKQGFKCPDLLILEPRNGWHGLFIELKTKSPFKKDGNIYENEHLKGQAMTIGKLTEKGYLACFSWSFQQTKEIIDGYMKEPRKG